MIEPQINFPENDDSEDFTFEPEDESKTRRTNHQVRASHQKGKGISVPVVRLEVRSLPSRRADAFLADQRA